MNAILLTWALAMLAFVWVMAPNEGGPAAMLMLPILGVVWFLTYRLKTDRQFLVRIFLSAVMVRVLIGTLIYTFNWQEFFGGDALTYDFFGYALLQVWEGNTQFNRIVDIFTGGGAGSGWGMIYYVAAIYKFVGQNMLATQYVNCILGAATVPISYLISIEIFANRRVARLCALMTAFFPSLVLWSSQALKDGPIIFLLTLTMLATLKLGDRFSVKYVGALAFSLFALLTLRFYIFYIVVVAVIAAFILGRRRLTAQSFARQMIIIIVVGMTLGYFGVTRYASQQIETYANVDQLRRMRLDASGSAQSGFGQDIDVSTTSGALTAIPLGLTYLILAPFPWQMASPRQLITLPEMLVWWASLPMLVLGGWFTVRHRLREVAPIVIFTALLTLTYSLLQGNVGTAYRQRAQLLVFYFVFVAVGFVLTKENREARANKKKAEVEISRQRAQWTREARKDHMPVAG
jgi:hypothetical protein